MEAAFRNATVARLTTLRVRRFRILPPLCSLVGHNPNQLANCFSLGKALRSAPASVITVCAVRTSIPLICDQSIPVMRYNSVRRSNEGALRLFFLPFGLGPIGCVVRSTVEFNTSRCWRDSRSQSPIFC